VFFVVEARAMNQYQAGFYFQKIMNDESLPTTLNPDD
jgi:hypothetical protein